MAKWYGTIGFGILEEKRESVWDDAPEERKYYGDLSELARRDKAQPDSTNDDIQLNMKLSIIADSYSKTNLYNIKYAEIYGTKWKVNSIEPQFPRLILKFGGRWNGPEPKTNSEI